MQPGTAAIYTSLTREGVLEEYTFLA